ncbi:hypothetical protein L9F63_021060, partial [Diploptera punctata]
ILVISCRSCWIRFSGFRLRVVGAVSLVVGCCFDLSYPMVFGAPHTSCPLCGVRWQRTRAEGSLIPVLLEDLGECGFLCAMSHSHRIRSGNNNINTNISSTASTNPNCQLVTDNNIDICNEVLGNSVCNTGTAGSLITKSDAGSGTAAQKRGRNSHTTSGASTGHASRRSTHEPTPSPTRKRNLLGSTVRSLFQSRNKDRRNRTTLDL